MASTVATPLEDQFSAIPGLASMTSTSGLGSTSITLQFDLSVNIAAAAGFVEQAIQAASALLPEESSEPANLQGGQSGRRADSHLRGSFRRLSDPGARSVRQYPSRPVALASERRRPGEHRRTGAARRAGAAQSQRARGKRTGLRADQRRADFRERSPSDRQSRRPPRGISARRQPAADQRRPVPQGDRGLQQRRAGSARGHRNRGRRAAKPPHRRLVRDPTGRGSVGLQGARRQHARRRRQHQGDDAAAREVDPAHGARRSRFRPLALDSRLRLGRRVHARAGARARRHGDLPFPAQVLGDRDSEHHFARRDRRDVRGDVSVRLQHRQSVADGAHDRHRVPCRRCDRDDREHRSPYRGGEAAPSRPPSTARAKSASPFSPSRCRWRRSLFRSCSWRAWSDCFSTNSRW